LIENAVPPPEFSAFIHGKIVFLKIELQGATPERSAGSNQLFFGDAAMTHKTAACRNCVNLSLGETSKIAL